MLVLQICPDHRTYHKSTSACLCADAQAITCHAAPLHTWKATWKAGYRYQHPVKSLQRPMNEHLARLTCFAVLSRTEKLRGPSSEAGLPDVLSCFLDSPGGRPGNPSGPLMAALGMLLRCCCLSLHASIACLLDKELCLATWQLRRAVCLLLYLFRINRLVVLLIRLLYWMAVDTSAHAQLTM